MSGTRTVVLCLAPQVEDRLLPQLAEAGLVVVARPAGAAAPLDFTPPISNHLDFPNAKYS